MSHFSNQCVTTIGVVLSVQHCWAPWWSFVRHACSSRFKPSFQFLNTSLTHTVHGTIFREHSSVYIGVFDPWNLTMAHCCTFVNGRSYLQSLWAFDFKNSEIQVKFDLGLESILEVEICVLLGFYAVWSGSVLLTFRDNILVPSPMLSQHIWSLTLITCLSIICITFSYSVISSK